MIRRGSLTRRALLRTAAAAGLVTACGEGEGPWPLPYAIPKSEVPGAETFAPGEERRVPTVCRLCSAGCGVRVRVVEGRAVKIEGNVAHPVNAGRLCDRGQAGLRLLYHPDRIHGPAKRIGPRGTGRFCSVSWDEAMGAVGDALAGMRRDGAPERLAALTAGRAGTTNLVLARFMAAYGSPNLLTTETDPAALALGLLLQGPVRTVPDIAHSRYVLSFGARLTEAYQPSLGHLRTVQALARAAGEPRVKLVQVEPRLSVTGAKADEWVPVRPGGEGALALSIAHVLLREDLHDRAFVAERCTGFDDWQEGEVSRRGFRGFVLEQASPEQTEALTGVAPATVARIAKEMAAHRPALVLPPSGASGETEGLASLVAVQALNALLGSFGTAGGVLVQGDAPVLALPESATDDIGRRGRARPRIDGAAPAAALAGPIARALPDAVLSERPYSLGVLLFHTESPDEARVGTERFRQALRKLPLVVSFSPWVDEVTAFADWVLPDCTYLERGGDTPAFSPEGLPVLCASRPAVAPLHDVRDTARVLLALAKGLGDPVAAALPYAGVDDVVAGARSSIGCAGVGASGVWTGAAPEPAEVKVRFHAPETGTADVAEFLLPVLHPRDARGAADAWSLVLHPFRTHPAAIAPGAHGLHRPTLAEFMGERAARGAEPWCEMNPATAAAHRLSDGDAVSVEVPGRSGRFRLRCHGGAVPGVVHVPHDAGRSALGGPAPDARFEAAALADPEVEPRTGLLVRPLVRARVQRS